MWKEKDQSVDAHSYMVLVRCSTQILFTCVCECMYCVCVRIYWGGNLSAVRL